MSVRLTRRTFLTGSAAAIAMPVPAFAQAKPDQDRAPHRQDRPARRRWHPDGAGNHPFPEGPELHAGRPQGRARGRRHRRQPRGHQDQDPGAGRARQRRHDLRSARRVRAARDQRIHRAGEDASSEPRRGRGHDPAQAEPVLHPRLRHLIAEHAPAGRLRGEGAEVQAGHHHRGRLRVRARADGRFPARLRGRRRPRREEALAAAGDAGLHAVHRADQRRRRRRPGLRRLQSSEVHEAVPRRGPQAARARRWDRLRRRAPRRATATRRSA